MAKQGAGATVSPGSSFRKTVVLQAGAAALAAVTLGTALPARADPIGIADYMIVATADGNLGTTVNFQDSELGAIGHNPATSPPSSGTPIPSGAQGGPTVGVKRDGDVAVTSGNGTALFSNTHVHALNTGPSNPGSQGVDCQGACFNGGISNSQFNTSAPAPIFSNLANNNGVQGNINLTTVLSSVGPRTRR